MSEEKLREALEDMAFQFSYRSTHNNRPNLITGGLSALESAFNALGWDDPHPLPEEGNTCEIKGCMNEPTSGQHWGKMYLNLCYKHSEKLHWGRRRPPVKDYAILRESKRDKKTGILNNE
jgi:hypothetical protein